VIQSQELLIIFIGTLLVASFVVYTLSYQVNSSVGEAGSVSTEVQSKTVSSYEIVQVYENNVYVRGVSGKLNPFNALVTVNGLPVEVNVVLLRDSGDVNLLEADDLAVLVLGTAVDSGDCVFIDLDGVSTLWGVCG